ncbi:hypothetical protein A2634_03995 [Candidatus Amesbacteria bacterium RIFCSPHIGHO2_01_FULL_48_32]|uniref:Glycosyltransferase 2-like domain-containing protein n=1 Tax=Candidatus Amesbacteria bacterium RIFCSPLOWO2_01_FULL_48_25 TaxID=1797259 RepID=A0A1F4ZC71_9BACT|nr:MAG: hypothetical protein A2634_03995 [Candidatus Amesbacteria bacterium RIFCSPHIGHO2_01_FULL_48_32]OGD03930.1 MAG: hypothetical protein A2989_04510 [Candidatus Amesbacteria bacterium RIFCSPLOWO2_01_FULL_48_25]
MLTAVVLARNEAQILPRSLKSLKFCDAILVIDDNSTDNTIQVAQKYKVKVVSHALAGNFASQRNFALSQIKSGWALFVDADEVVTPNLAEEISKELKNPLFHAYFLKREDVMWGKRLKAGDSRASLIRLGRIGMGRWTGKVHETWVIEGRVGELKNLLTHYPHPSLYKFLSKINFYSSLRAQELRELGQKSSLAQIIFYPILKFLHLGIWKLGFADGTAGFICAMVMAFHTFLTRGKLYLISKGISIDA